MQVDVVIVGAGPAGLCLARSLSGNGLSVTVVEQQAEAAIAAPAFDGREIALTQHSAKVMKQLGLWDRIDPRDVAQLRDAKVMDGISPHSMVIPHSLGAHRELGWLASNHFIRKAAWESLQEAIRAHGDVNIMTEEKVVHIAPGEASSTVRLASGKELTSRLVVAADSRFSTTRRMMGIAAEMHDFGRNMVVCSMTHDNPHDFTAWEWFDYGQTLALLPMNPDPVTNAHRSSVVITLPSPEAERMVALEEDAFNRNVADRYHGRLGSMKLVSTRHAYPLVGVYPKRLVAQRFATVGDAAVGMHPVTAHGFNFGLLSVMALSGEILAAQRLGLDIAGRELLDRYEWIHRRATLPLYLATRLVVEIYTNESAPAKLVRRTLLRLGEKLVPFKRSIASSLAGG